MFADADGDTLTYTAAAQHPALLGVSLSGDPGEAHLQASLLNQGSSQLTFTATDAYGGSVTRTATIGISATVSRSIAENAPAGTAVGAPVTGTPYGDEALSYSLTGEAATSGAFSIDAASGQISVAEGASLDYETKASYTGRVEYTVQGQAAAIDVTINVTDLTPPARPDAPTLTRTRFSEPSNPALDVTWTAPAAVTGVTLGGYEAQYRKQVGEGETPEAWTTYTYVDPVTNTATSQLAAASTSLTLPDLDAGAAYEIQIRAVSSGGERGPWSATGAGQANRPPTTTALALQDRELARGEFFNESIGTSYFEDPEGDDLSFSASAEHPGILRARMTGEFETSLTVEGLNPSSSTVTYGAHDGYGGYVSRSFVVTVTDSATRSVREDVPAATLVGDPVTGTAFQGEAMSYTLTGEAADSGAFAIDADSGQISVAEDANLDYNDKSSYTGTVEYTVQDQPATIALTIEVTRKPTVSNDPPHRPTKVSPRAPDRPAVSRSAAQPATALDVAWTAPDTRGGPAITDYDVEYRKKNGGHWLNHPFTGAATKTTLTGLSPETTYEVRVRARNADGRSGWSSPGEGATARQNLPPRFASSATARSVPENSPAGTRLGDPVTASDPDGHSLTYALREASSLFDLDSATGQLSVAAGASLDYEAGASYTLVVQVSDGLDSGWAGDSQVVDAEVTVTVSVTDVAEAPAQPDAPAVRTPAGGSTTSLDVNWTAPDMTGKPAISDYDVQYRPVGTATWTDHDFAGAGTSTTLTGLDFGTMYQVQVLARNDEGDSPWSQSGAGVTGPTRLNATRQVSEDAPSGAPVGAPVTATSPQGHTLAYAIVDGAVSGSGGGRNPFTINSRTGQIRVAQDANLDRQAANRHTLTVRASHTASGSADNQIVNAVISVVINVTAVPAQPGDGNSPPGFGDQPGSPGTVRRYVAENSAGGTRVGDPVTATDADGDTLTYALSGSNAFVIDAASGQIRVASGAVLDYETANSYSVTVSVSDGKDAQGNPDASVDATADVTIRLLDQLPPNRPDAPTVTPSAADSTALHVTWTAPANQDRPAITDYDLRYRQVGAASWTAHDFVGAGTITWIAGLDPDTAYEVQVAAASVEGLGPWSEAGAGRTPPPGGNPGGPNDPDDPNGPVGPNDPNTPNGTNGPGDSVNPGGDSGNPASTNPPGGSSDGPSVTTLQVRAADRPVLAPATAPEQTEAGYGAFSREQAGPTLANAAFDNPLTAFMSGFGAWTPEKALLFSFVWPALLAAAALLSQVLQWKYQVSIWTAVLAGLAAIFLFFWRRRKREEDEGQAGQAPTLRPAT